MADHISIWPLADDSSTPNLFDKVKALGEETLASLRVRLELEEVLNWPINFWDVEDKRRIWKKMERLNEASSNVYIIPTVG